ncbi:MAG: ABC transporter substrate-binding protein, partial [Phormidesmis sp.]
HNPVRAAQIADKYARARPDVIVAIALPSAQAAIAATKNTPIIFSAVTDPLGENLVKTLNRPGGNVSGVSDRAPISQYLALIKEILPSAQTLGIVYSAAEDSSVSLVDLLKVEAPEQGFTAVQETEVGISNGAIKATEVIEATRQLVGSVDAIYVPPDAAAGIIESVIQVGQDNDVPVFGQDADAVRKGAIAGMSFSYDDIGHQTGDMVIKVLKGNRPGDIPVEFIDIVQLSVNPTSAEEMGVTLPASVIERAAEVME